MPCRLAYCDIGSEESRVSRKQTAVMMIRMNSAWRHAGRYRSTYKDYLLPGRGEDEEGIRGVPLIPRENLAITW